MLPSAIVIHSNGSNLRLYDIMFEQFDAEQKILKDPTRVGIDNLIQFRLL